MFRTRLLLVLALFLIMLSACGSSESDADGDAGAAASTTVAAVTTTIEPQITTTAAPTTTTTAATTTTTEESAVATATGSRSLDPDGPVAEQLDWAVALLNGADVTVEDVETRFAPIFLAQVPASLLLSTADTLFAEEDLPVEISDVMPTPDGLGAEALLVSSAGDRSILTVHITADDPALIDGLLIQPAPELIEGDLTEIGTALDELGGASALGLFEIVDGECVNLDGIDTAEVLPLGSVFKLWVLAELAHQVAAGTASWDETLAVDERLMSSPDGEIFMMEPGTAVTLEEYAELMIAISDNSATDHLIDRLGRVNVEAAIARSGVENVDLNVPLLATGDLFQLKFLPEAPNSADYRALDVEGRRELLEGLRESVLPWLADDFDLAAMGANADGVAITDPRDLDIEYFASTEDLCRTHAHLAELAEMPGLEPVAEILEVNPGAGIDFDRERFPVIRFKGGSEPGVIAGAWWLRSADDRTFVVAGMVENETTAFDSNTAVAAIASAVNLLPAG